MHKNHLCSHPPLTRAGSAALDISNFLLYSYKEIHEIFVPILVPNKPVATVSVAWLKEGLKVKQMKLHRLRVCYISQASKMMDGTIGTKQPASVFHLTLSANK